MTYCPKCKKWRRKLHWREDKRLSACRKCGTVFIRAGKRSSIP